MVDMVNHPKHYNEHPSGVECIDIVEHMGFNLGNVVKYVWRADLKGTAVQDLKKALFYIERELEKRGESKETGLRKLNELERQACDAIAESFRRFETNYQEGSVLDFKNILQHCATWEDNRRAEREG